MAVSFKKEHRARYRDLARLLIKYGGSDLLSPSGLDEALPAEDGEQPEESTEEARELAADLERMGPTYIKLGQLFSTRPDIFPPPVLESLTRLQDKVEPFPYDDVERIVSEELGARISKAFREFDREPLAAASLAQVHAAVLRNGRRVAVKVQRPGIRTIIRSDMEVLEDIADTLDKRTKAGKRFDFVGMLEEFRQSLMRELDFRQEAHNLERLAKNLVEFHRIFVPRPVEDYTTSRVLTMDFVAGRKITSLSPMARMEMDGAGLAEELFHAYLKQTLVDGFFHADPHPGNVFLTDDHRLALLDLGMVARMDGEMQENLLKLLLAVSEGRGHDVAELGIEMGDHEPDFEPEEFSRDVAALVSRYQEATVQDIDIGRVVMEINRRSGERGIRLPAALTMLGKTLLNLDQVGRALDPDFDPNAAIRSHAGEIMRQRMLKDASPTHLLGSALELNEFLRTLPRRLNRLFDDVSRNELKLKVDALDEVHLMEGIQKVANRITMGLVVAALIIGAAMMMQVETEFEILGYPGVAMISFLVAVAGGIALVLDIVLHDEKMDQTPPPR